MRKGREGNTKNKLSSCGQTLGDWVVQLKVVVLASFAVAWPGPLFFTVCLAHSLGEIIFQEEGSFKYKQNSIRVSQCAMSMLMLLTSVMQSK